MSAAAAPHRRTSASASGVRAVSPANTARNHSGSRTSVTTVRIVPELTPARAIAAVSGTQTATSTATGRLSRDRRPRSQAR